MSTSTPTRRSTRNRQSTQLPILSSSLAPSTVRQSRKRSIGKVETAEDEFVDLSDVEEGRGVEGTCGVNEVTGMLTPPPTKERERKKRNLGTDPVSRG